MKQHFTTAAAALLAAAIPTAALAAEEPQDCPVFDIRGEGADVILIPGLGSSPDTWTGMVEEMGGEYRFHLVSVPGFAGEPATEPKVADVPAELASMVDRYIECSALDRPAIVGHSMGGFTAMLVARDYPESVSRLVVVDALPFYPLIFDPKATEDSVAGQATAIAASVRQMEPAQFRAMQDRTARMLTKTPDKVDTIVEWSFLSDRETFASAMTSLMTTDLRPDLANIEAPVTILYATNAFATSERVTPLFTSAYADLQDGTLVEIPDSYHFTMFDQPDLTARALRNALASE